MNSVAVKPVHRSWIVLAAKVVVVLQSLAIVYMLTSGWVAAVVAACFVAIVAAVKALSRASRQVDRIFEEELG
ncbi:hypothetical protein [Lentzea flava]|uniref:Uncharacterized protein n=1 Tax=Lentzea flava TaxID=103732 RepID=A0ABQ2USA8_9PSEU|nr:hypothetical protein [Lentzea flava]MCP2201305.1 hypothetical protein [Lentzea flava]GGU49199.1 hypothetical protein GCM10010178_47390 [Lentzea flava]